MDFWIVPLFRHFFVICSGYFSVSYGFGFCLSVFVLELSGGGVVSSGFFGFGAGRRDQQKPDETNHFPEEARAEAKNTRGNQARCRMMLITVVLPVVAALPLLIGMMDLPPTGLVPTGLEAS